MHSRRPHLRQILGPRTQLEQIVCIISVFFNILIALTNDACRVYSRPVLEPLLLRSLQSFRLLPCESVQPIKVLNLVTVCNVLPSALTQCQ